MTYLTQNDIATNRAILDRSAQAAAQEGISTDPDRWVYDNRRRLAGAPGWSEAWESSLVAHPEEDYDPGSDEAVITDGMILSQVQAMGPTPPAGGQG